MIPRLRWNRLLWAGLVLWLLFLTYAATRPRILMVEDSRATFEFLVGQPERSVLARYAGFPAPTFDRPKSRRQR